MRRSTRGGLSAQGTFWRRVYRSAVKPVCLACIGAVLVNLTALIYGLDTMYDLSETLGVPSIWIFILVGFYTGGVFLAGSVVGKYWGE